MSWNPADIMQTIVDFDYEKSADGAFETHYLENLDENTKKILVDEEKVAALDKIISICQERKSRVVLDIVFEEIEGVSL